VSARRAGPKTPCVLHGDNKKTTRVGNPKAENPNAEGVRHEQQACSAKAVFVGLDGTGRGLVMGTRRRWIAPVVGAGEALVLLDAVRRRWVPAHRGLVFVLAEAGSAAAGLGIMAQLRRDRMS
jgi:hypothetical protein